jgi:hypothetical protein
VFSTACDSASITSLVSKWRHFSFIFNWETEKSAVFGDESHVVFRKNSLVEDEM